MKLTTPQVYLIAEPQLNYSRLQEYLDSIGAHDFLTPERIHNTPPGELLVEVGGRLCYRSFAVGLNPNVTKIREDPQVYHENILRSGHGSVLQHANYTFIMSGVSRVFTHELVRHAMGASHSQESMRYVRLDDIPMWIPDWALDDPMLMTRIRALVEHSEEFIRWMAEDYFKLDEPDGSVSFAEKKAKTSFMRRFAPAGHSTSIMSTFNVRSIRHIIHLRTALPAEEEIRIVVDAIAEAMLAAVPNLMQDFNVNEDREWIPDFVKV